MGCVLSSVDPHRCRSSPASLVVTSRLFDVYNIDDRGQEQSPGRIEVGDEELVLHQGLGKDPVRWPLRSLRRYGFDSELFSFESGRRCPTGPGIYAFKCLRAEALFGLLQESIIRAGQLLEGNRHHHHHHLPLADMTINIPIDTVSSSSSSEWISIQRHLPTDQSTDQSIACGAASMANDYINQRQLSSSSSAAAAAASSISHHCHQHKNYINNDSSRSINIRNNEELKLPVFERPEVLDEDEAEVLSSPSLFRLRSASNGGGHFRCAYVNLPSPPEGVFGDNSELVSRGRQYVNIGSARGVDQRVAQLHVHPPTARWGAAVTYAQLDLFGEGTSGARKECPSLASSSSSSSPGGSGPAVDVEPSRRVRPMDASYASIDFQRTKALSSKVEDEPNEGHRKTRHNSSIDSNHL